MPPPPDLIERTDQCAALRQAISDRTGGLVVLDGPPGAGCSVLLRYAQARARRASVASYLIRCTDLEQTRELGVAQQLADQASRQGGCAVVVHPALTSSVLPGVPPPPIVVVLLDDARWCDRASADWLVDLAHRGDGPTRVLLVVARPGESTGDGFARDWPADLPVHHVPVTELSPAGSRALLARLAPGIPDELVPDCHAATTGNPRLLCELAAAFTAAPTRFAVGEPHAAGSLTLDQVAAALTGHAAHQLAMLPTPARRLGVAIAVLDTITDHTGAADPWDGLGGAAWTDGPGGDRVDATGGGGLATAAVVAGQDTAVAAVAAARLVAAGLLESTDPPRYRHRAVRAAVYRRLTAVERRALHAASAAALAAAGADPVRIAAHLLVAPLVGRPWAAEALGRAARAEVGAGRARAAHAYLIRQADEMAGHTPQAGRGHSELGHLAMVFDLRAAAVHLRAAVAADPTDPVSGAELTDVLLLSGDPTTTPPGDSVGRVNPLRQARHGLLDPRHAGPAERQRLLAAVQTRTSQDRTRLYAARAMHATLAGHPHAVPAAHDALNGPACTGMDLLFAWLSLLAADVDVRGGLDALTDPRPHDRDVDRAVAHVCRALGLLRLGDLGQAERTARTALDLADRTGLAVVRPLVLAALGDALLEQGRPVEAGIALDGTRCWATDVVRARLLRHGGDPRAAAEVALVAGESFEAHGGQNPAVLPWRGEVARAWALLGRDAEATAMAGEQVRLARRWGAPLPVGHALRVAGLVAATAAPERAGRAVDLLGEAVEVLAASSSRLEHAKALADLGAALRRTNNRGAARAPLRRALELALACGAAPLLARIRAELAITGERRQAATAGGPPALSPQERRIADLAASRASNVQIAQALHISIRTVKDHLSSVYRKLDVTGRRDLAARLGPAGATDAADWPALDTEENDRVAWAGWSNHSDTVLDPGRGDDDA